MQRTYDSSVVDEVVDPHPAVAENCTHLIRAAAYGRGVGDVHADRVQSVFCGYRERLET